MPYRKLGTLNKEPAAAKRKRGRKSAPSIPASTRRPPRAGPQAAREMPDRARAANVANLLMGRLARVRYEYDGCLPCSADR